MSAALVESVRDTVDAEESVEIHRVHGTPGVPPLALISRAQMLRAKLDLPAILAALTEGEALRAQVAESQAREVALREAGERLRRSATDGYGYKACADFLEVMDATPTDTAALRAMLVDTINEAWSLYGTDTDTNVLIERIIDRVLGGS